MKYYQYYFLQKNKQNGERETNTFFLNYALFS